jgi:hypothetical protein
MAQPADHRDYGEPHHSNVDIDSPTVPAFVSSHSSFDPADMFRAYPRTTRSIYALTREEIARGLANRFVHSRTYIFLYLGMAALSVTTVVLSLTDGCPGLAFYILEIVINTAMILEVGIRFVALGRVRIFPTLSME